MNLAESFAVRPILYWVPMYFVFKTLAIIWRKFLNA
jgi:receptor expression-enhancing protein 5/6